MTALWHATSAALQPLCANCSPSRILSIAVMRLVENIRKLMKIHPACTIMHIRTGQIDALPMNRSLIENIRLTFLIVLTGGSD
jgi:hypothetical protein